MGKWARALSRGTSRDGDGGAAERRLAEALRAQASLGARSAPAPAPHPPSNQAHHPEACRPEARGPQAAEPAGPKAPQNPTQEPAPTSSPGPRGGAGAPSAAGQSGPHGRGSQSGPQRPAAAALHGGAAHLAPPPGRTGHSGGQRARPRDDQLPTTKVATAEPGLAGAPDYPAAGHPVRLPAPPPLPGSARRSPGAVRRHPPGHPAAGGADRRAARRERLLGCALALLSVLQPGLLPALG